jgi:hypothetical protein
VGVGSNLFLLLSTVEMVASPESRPSLGCLGEVCG